MEGIKKISQMLNESKYAVVFTGSGISAESGIPTFRGVDGLWKKYNPEEVASIYGFKRNPSAFWEFAKELILKSNAEPNPAHYAIAELEREGVVKAVITQNIDMLHQRAGSRRVLELHGSMNYVDCLDCEAVYEWEYIAKILKERQPVCEKCGGEFLKPRVVFFGEPLSYDVLTSAMEEARKADLFLVIGSSLVVYPAASLPEIAKKSGAKLALINLEPVEKDFIFDVVVYGKAGEVMKKVLEEFKKLRG
ncbi:NAD-dependent protein deacetylase, SIR2 family [Archaeoglobus sulfaticallidus PM70-1]|uniref:NAD-dependent protein deacylase n=1 Tax=Archaeoglobus sulfaticallidus PM70-1 TaxID=387631 RepID=N0BLH2_9EURY|nr:NAD-dependent protein deacetylase [Archaeoglobus sulfaticallidus]AGK61035.1 NAD-dependent protein deacetylase, SIR2 family [Archaeoglobus sulfaticallidus PM70-1]